MRRRWASLSEVGAPFGQGRGQWSKVEGSQIVLDLEHQAGSSEWQTQGTALALSLELE